MAKGSSQSQASSVVSRGAGGPAAGAPPRGSAAASSLRRRRTTSSSGGASGGGGGGGGYGGNSNMLRFYTDDAPGLKISPTVVLIMSLCFIGFVTALHPITGFSLCGEILQGRSDSDDLKSGLSFSEKIGGAIEALPPGSPLTLGPVTQL
ncbi:hypothetical protein AXG93_3786s1140 [Marchantia polymorpha subsp. ruderalis]|uniref:Protein transport protein Sec61 subunit beta n=1 Tax=Marchantia polymorpha subsp. ruderalis TaxID=1480154 RepID=A0A176W182_MARPO|nr:hypothetical protein AXG93_3786s1140 [Marchantia polymorpha subsp. ruderalis]